MLSYNQDAKRICPENCHISEKWKTSLFKVRRFEIQ